MESKELAIEAEVKNLETVNGFVAQILETVDCSMRVQMQIDLVVEEIFVNIASYAYGENKGLAIIRGRILEEPTRLELVFMDEGQPYDPLAKEDPDTSLRIEDREVGGLGIFLVKKSVDDIQYEYRDGKNVLTICKKL